MKNTKNYIDYLIKFNPNLRENFSDKTKETLNKLYNLLKDREENIYLVGGMARDIFLGRDSHDIDLVMDGNPQDVASSVIENFNVKKHRFNEKFLTYNIFMSGETNIDIAQFRTEIYETPGALPTVFSENNLEKDCLRRDFTINSIYISLDEKAKLYDPLNGLKDLKDGIIRVIHEKSFYDDPTRILRAIKFAGRYNYEISERTSKLLEQGVKNNYLSLISDTRLANEIYGTLEEKNIDQILIRMKRYKIFDYFQIANLEDEDIIKFTDFLKTDFFKNYKRECKISMTHFILAFIVEKMEQEKKIEFFKRLGFGNRTIKNIIFTEDEREKIIKLVENASSNCDIYGALNSLNPLKLILILWYFRNKKDIENIKKIEYYIYELSHIKMLVNGRDIINLGIKDGKLIKKHLEKAIEYQLKMENPTKEKIIAKIMLEIK